jgi:GT2 family glycosyltransferase
MDMHTLPTLNVIVPFSRPQNIVNVLNNFHRQTYYNKKLIIVENGEATGRSYGADKTLTEEIIIKHDLITHLLTYPQQLEISN